jgi:hypothetical protein
MYSVDLNYLNTPYDRRDFFNLGMNEASHVTAAKEVQRSIDDSGVFKSPLETIPGVKMISAGLGLIRGGFALAIATPETVVGPVGGVIMIGGGLVEATIGIGIFGLASYEFLRDRFRGQSQPAKESVFHLIEPKDLSFSNSGNEGSLKEQYRLLNREEHNFDDIKDSLKQLIDLVKDASSSLKEGHESNIGRLSDQNVDETENNNSSDHQSRL